MRNFLTLGFFLLINILFGQEYINESCKWKVKNLAYSDLYYFNIDYQDYIEGDTLIENTTYFKVYRKGKSIVGLTHTASDSLGISEFHEYKGAILEENKIW